MEISFFVLRFAEQDGSDWEWWDGAWKNELYWEHDRHNPGQDCAWIDPKGRWYDGNCASPRRFICGHQSKVFLFSFV